MSSRAALAGYLLGTTPWPATAHDVLAHSLNEALWELGCPGLAPYRPPGNDPQTGPRRHEPA